MRSQNSVLCHGYISLEIPFHQADPPGFPGTHFTIASMRLHSKPQVQDDRKQYSRSEDIDRDNGRTLGCPREPGKRAFSPIGTIYPPKKSTIIWSLTRCKGPSGWPRCTNTIDDLRFTIRLRETRDVLLFYPSWRATKSLVQKAYIKHGWLWQFVWKK